jgi:hypothetical protein
VILAAIAQTVAAHINKILFMRAKMKTNSKIITLANIYPIALKKMLATLT